MVLIFNLYINIMNLVELYIQEKTSIYNFCQKYRCSSEQLIQELKSSGFLYAKPRASYNLIVNLKYASDEYLSNDKIQAQEICKKYNIGHESFSNYMKNYIGIPIKARVKSNFNEDYFDCIDSEEKAYILGFFWADGYISSSPININNPKNTYTIEIGLQLRDKEILELIKFSWKTPRPILIDTRKNCDEKVYSRCRLIVNSQHMWNTLNNYGCIPRKSLIEKFPDESIFIETDKYSKNDLIKHFIRGYFDGDGCISYVNKEHTVPNIQILGTEEFLKRLLTYLPNGTKNLTIRHNHNNEKEKIYFINTSHNKAIKILQYLYTDCNFYLTRKYNRYTALCCSNTTEARGNIGEGCDANTEINSEIAKGSESS